MQVLESASNLKYSENNSINIFPVHFGTIHGEQTYIMRKENEIVARDRFWSMNIFRVATFNKIKNMEPRKYIFVGSIQIDVT